MWRPDIIDLSQFYSGPLGHVVRRQLTRDVRRFWPDVSGQRVLGIGYATPFIRPFLPEAERLAAAMPANQGIQHWPREGPNRVFLSDELEMPLPDQSFDRILLVHALETSEQARPLLREIWRVLAPEGRLLIVVPNRRGLWARADQTPFGHGHPYSNGQLLRLLKSTMYQPVRSGTGLHLPPVAWRPLLRLHEAFERMGPRFWPRFAGVVVVEAAKQIYAAPTQPQVRRRRLIRSAPALSPATRDLEPGSIPCPNRRQSAHPAPSPKTPVKKPAR